MVRTPHTLVKSRVVLKAMSDNPEYILDKYRLFDGVLHVLWDDIVRKRIVYGETSFTFSLYNYLDIPRTAESYHISESRKYIWYIQWYQDLLDIIKQHYIDCTITHIENTVDEKFVDYVVTIDWS
jgi:hypothetical protein